MKNNKEIYVQLKKSERKYFKIYFDFLYNKLLTGEEKFIFIILKSFIDFSNDNNGVQGEVYPSIQTICEITGYGNKKVTKILHSLKSKGIIEIVHRGLTQSNLYTLADYSTMWDCESVEEMVAVADNQGLKPLTPEQHIAELERMGYTVQIKEKELETEPTKAQNQAPNKNISDMDKDNTNKSKSQELERYTMMDIKMLYEYGNLIIQYPAKQTDIDVVFDILYDTLNSTKQTIKVGGEDKPTMVVIGRLMKLQPDDLIYSIDKYHEQTDRIKNVKSYLLTILYNSREQNHLDIMNLGHHNGDF